MRCRHVLFSLVIGLVGAACQDTSQPGAAYPAERPSPDTLRAQLRSSDWVFAYYTAALGGDRKHWLVFDEADSFTRVDWAWMYDGEHSYPTDHWDGSYTVDAGRQVETTWWQGTVQYRESFLAAVIEDAPRVYGSDTPTIPTGGRALSTRVYIPTGPGRWTTEFGRSVEGANTVYFEHTRVDATLDLLDGSTCALTLLVKIEVDGVIAQETLSPPCTVGTDSDTGWSYYGAYDQVPYQWNALQELGLDDQYSPEVFRALVAAYSPVLLSHPAYPGLLIPPYSSDEMRGWFDAATNEPPAPKDGTNSDQ